MSFITGIGTAAPANRFNQSTIAEFMIKAMELRDDDARKLRALYRATGIETRNSVISDYGRSSDYSFFANTVGLKPMPGTRSRLDLFRKHALPLSIQSARAAMSNAGVSTQEVTHLIVVSCTGFYAPGLDIEMVRELGLQTSIHRTCIHFMGCYAAFNAMKLAEAFCSDHEHAVVLITCTELCSLHFQQENTEDNILANALFADGSASAIVRRQPGKAISLETKAFFCDLAQEGNDDMAWMIGDSGFEMRLSSYVPEIIRSGIKTLTDRLMASVKGGDEKAVSYYAIHPGGKRILEVIEQQLGLDATDNRFSYRVLKQYGNMSSATVLFVLAELLAELTPEDHGKNVLSFAFGPGLTLESMLMQVASR